MSSLKKSSRKAVTPKWEDVYSSIATFSDDPAVWGLIHSEMTANLKSQVDQARSGGKAVMIGENPLTQDELERLSELLK